MNIRILFVTVTCLALPLTASTGFAKGDDQNLEKLGSFKRTDSAPMKRVEQGGKYAANLEKVLQGIKMPPGFKIELFAIAPDARHMAVSRNKGTVWIGTRKTTVWSATDRDMDNVADTVEEFSPSVQFDIPNGVCYSPDGFLFIVERNRVMMFPAAEFFMEGSDTVAVPIVKQGELIPADEESYNHTARVCAIGPDDKLYISLGQPHNVTPADKVDMYRKAGIGGMLKMNRDGTGREVIATGIRNSVGHAFNPKDGSLWFTDNQVDGMGDEIPPGELNRMPEEGMWFGHPYYGGGEVRTNEYKDQEIPAELDIQIRKTTGRDGRPCGRSGHDVLHWKHVPGEVQERHLQRPARFLERRKTQRCTGDGDLPGRGRQCHRHRAICRGLDDRQWLLSGTAGRCTAVYRWVNTRIG